LANRALNGLHGLCENFHVLILRQFDGQTHRITVTYSSVTQLKMQVGQIRYLHKNLLFLVRAASLTAFAPIQRQRTLQVQCVLLVTCQ